MFVGSDDLHTTTWRNTGYVKPLDADHDNVFGTAGYVMYAVDPLTGNQGDGSNPSAGDFVNPLYFSTVRTAGGTRTVQTYKSIPEYFTLTNQYQHTVSFGMGYPTIDDPTGASAGVEAGFAGRAVALGTETSMMQFTINAGFPAEGVRIGVLLDHAGPNSTASMRLTPNGASGTQVITQGETSLMGFYFFDVTNAVPGDKLNLFLTPRLGDISNFALYRGVTIDALPVPEPSVLWFFAIALPLIASQRRVPQRV